jgi:hypothetical protein
MKLSIQERESTLEELEKHLEYISRMYKECYLEKGRGSIILYSFHVNNIKQLSCIDYNTEDESLALFEDKKSRSDLRKLINNYDPKKQGVLVLITKSTATWFITVNLKSKKL